MRSLVSAVLAAACVSSATPALASPYADAVLADEPVAYFRFDERSGDSVRDAAGSLSATAGKGVTLGADGPEAPGLGAANLAASFSADGADAIDLGTSINQALKGAEAITLEFWLADDYGQTKGENFVPVFIGTGGTTGANATVRNNTIRIGGRAEPSKKFKAGKALPLDGEDGEPVHVVGVVDYANGKVLTYLDGELADETEQDFEGTAFKPGPAGASLGGVKNKQGFANPYEGTLDEVAIYGRALSAAEVAAHFQAATAPEPN